MKKGIISIIIAVVVIGGGYLAYSTMNSPSPDASSQAGNTNLNNQTNSTQATNTGSKINNSSVSNVNQKSNNSTDKSNSKVNVLGNQQGNKNDNNVANNSNEKTQSNTNINTPMKVENKNVSNSNNSDSDKSSNQINEKKDNGVVDGITLYGDIIPGTSQRSHNVIVKNEGQENATILPKEANEFGLRFEKTGAKAFDKINIASGTYYTKTVDDVNRYEYYIIKPQNINQKGLKVATSLNPNYLNKINANKTVNKIKAVGVLSSGIIIGKDIDGGTVYLEGNTLENPVSFEAAPMNIMLKNGVINTGNTVLVRGVPMIIPTLDTIGNTINQNGLHVAIKAEINGYSEIVFGTNRGIFGGWVQSSAINLQ